MTVSVRFQIGGHKAADWTSGNPVLLEREFAAETDTGKFKLGDGVTAWSALPYQAFWSRWGRITGNLADQADLGSLAGRSTINGNDWNGADLPVTHGGTGASSAPAARTALGAAAAGVNDDIKRLTGLTTPLSADQGGTGDTGGAWTAYTPTVTAGSGALASVSAFGRYKRIGKTVFVRIAINVTNNGSAAGYLIVSLPAAAVQLGNTSMQQAVPGKEVLAAGFAVTGNIGDGLATMNVTRASDSSYPAGTNYCLALTGVYEAA